ncbi:Transferase [Corchorus olitorius]|uniref:Transferase n=1 Tax=Corchorus olitorius TaxID=93759 RepID=A0A1R3GJ57_9ROSI|nr:Transferase [Corchorus olitorius]
MRIISSNIVRAANHQESSRIDLNPWDLRFLPIRPIQKGILFHKPTPLQLQEKETDENNLIHHLKASLSKTLDYFPPLAGRLATVNHVEDDTISYFIDCNNAGALFIHAAANAISISDIIEPVYVPQTQIVHSLFPLNGLKNYEGVANPLLGIQVTDLVDGIFIGCTMNHSVADGSSFWHFFNLWSEISKDSIPLSKLPVFQRWLPNGIDFPFRIPKSYLQQVYVEDQFIVPPLQERVFHFTKENIAKLKAKANAEVGANNNISSLQALLSHIWRSVIRNRNYDGDEETSFRIIIGARQRLQELPDGYFGNALLGTFVTMKAKELLKEGIGKVAWEMNRAIASITEHSFKSFLVAWLESPEMSTMNLMTNIDKCLVTFNSPRFNAYGNDFGWGKPIAARSGAAYLFDGKMALYCGAEEGSIDIQACLSPETLEAMGNDEEFMDAVTF